MEQNQNFFPPEAATDEPVSPANPSRPAAPASAEPPCFEPPPLLSDALEDAIADTLEDTFTPEAPKPRHDGWTPEAIAAFLRALAGGGVVEHAARAAGLSAQAAYAFRNRRHGRAFARMWDAVLVHRSRSRLAAELQSRAIAGCVSVRKKDGLIVGEYHYYDNRLAASLLTRLDRLAEREEGSDAHLRALSEDLDDYLDCLATGGDADAFVEARAPKPEVQPTSAAPAPVHDPDPEVTTFAQLAGCPDYLDVDPFEIEVRDLDPTRKSEWAPEQWVRAFRSGFLTWLEVCAKDGDGDPPGPGAPLCFLFCREAARLAYENGPTSDGEEVDTADLNLAEIWDWTDDQLVRAHRGGLLAGLTDEFWDKLAEDEGEAPNAGVEE